ncbi:protein ImuB [Litoreibacter ponti]|uniref:Protein ImuB n=1 Tax=Litoreibacter ponti TaxID=1510457 RepID=A0A2T6BPV4_9RHOB|nr:DNA polymerase Y family protein [Litoreibacter ponti]PTX58076.1 protein ImuB [Litoreibacter ponti]
MLPVPPAKRRVLCLWFPRLAAERFMRREGVADDVPVAVLRDIGNMQVIHSLNPAAEAFGLTPGQPMRDAMAMCPELRTRLANLPREAAFLQVLARWAGKFSPWVRVEGEAGLILDLTGCAHLFGGEEGLARQVEEDCAGFGFTVRLGLADTVGAAWALARFAGRGAGSLRSGDAIDAEARATRSRAAKRRHWERGGAAPKMQLAEVVQAAIAPPGQTRGALAPLPMAALRLDPDVVTGLARVGLRRVEDVMGMPRAALARRFGMQVVRRLDQALGLEPEPVSPAKPADHFAVRLSFPDPIGLEADVLAGIDRLLEPLCEKLRKKGRGARRIRLQAFRTDETSEILEVGLARASNDPDRMRPLLAMKLGDLDVGFGLDVLRLEAVLSEPLQARQHRGHLEASADVAAQMTQDTEIDDLIGRLGARVGLEAITRVHPASSHIPEKGAIVLAAAWSEPCESWPEPELPRPLTLFPPEPVTAAEVPIPPETFKWRGRHLTLAQAVGPERISPEWWLDEPEWRTGVRDYWRVDTKSGDRLWLFYAHGAAKTGGWFCQGDFG